MPTFTLAKVVPLTADEVAAGLTADDIVGVNYPPGHVYRYVTNTVPGTTAVDEQWQKFLSLGGRIDLDARVNDVFRQTEQWVIVSGTTLRMGPDCVILRDWGGDVGAKLVNACFKNEHAPSYADVVIDPGPWVPSVTDDDIYIEGGRIRPVDDTCIGAGWLMVGTTNLTMRNCVVERTYQDWAFVVGGENFSCRGFRVEENSEVLEDGFHIMYGSGVAQGDYVHSGDDCFAIGGNYNLPVNGVDIHMGSFYSNKAFAIKVAQEREGSTVGFTAPDQVIQNVRFHSGTGMAGVNRNGLVLIRSTDTTGVLKNITIDGVHLDAGSDVVHSDGLPYGVEIQDVDRLRMTNVTVYNARRDGIHLTRCTNAELNGCIVGNSQGSSTYRALEIDDCLNLKVVGGDYVRTLTAPIRVQGTSSVSFHAPLIREIGDNLAGIQVDDDGDVAVYGPTFRKASGAADSIGVRPTSTSAKVVLDGPLGNVDRPYFSTVVPAHVKVAKVSRTVTIASGAVVTYGDDRLPLLCEGGTADFVSSLEGGYTGQVVTLVNGEAVPATNTITVSPGTGANNFDIGSTYLMNSADDYLTVVFDGTKWKRISRGGALTGAFTTIELGADTDTTVGRIAAGRIGVENKELATVAPRVTTITSSATPTVNTDNTDFVTITALAAAITDASANLTGTPANGQRLTYRIKDDGTARAIAWGSSFQAGSVALPTTTVLGKTMLVLFVYDSVDGKWTCEAAGSRA